MCHHLPHQIWQTITTPGPCIIAQMILTLPFCLAVQCHLITLVHHPTMWVIDAQTLCPHPTPRKQRLQLPPAVASIVHRPSIHTRHPPPSLLLPLMSPTLHQRSMTFCSQVNHFPGSSMKKRAAVVMRTTMTRKHNDTMNAGRPSMTLQRWPESKSLSCKWQICG